LFTKQINYDDGEYTIGFYHFDVAHNSQLLSVPGYFALIFSSATLGVYFPHKKHCAIKYNHELVDNK